MNWTPIILSLKLSALTTLLLFLVGLPVSHRLANSNSKFKPILEAAISLPLVLPPTVIGFYLLMAFSPNNTLGEWLDQALGLQFIFSFEGLVIASMIYSLPFMLQPLQSGLQQVPLNMKESSYVLGGSKWKTLIKVELPYIKANLISAIVMTFAHTMGEFGVVLMIGGNIPGVTKVASIAIYDEVESLNYASAHQYAIVLLVFTFLLMVLTYGFNNRLKKKHA